jgi:flagellar motor component MotA
MKINLSDNIKIDKFESQILKMREELDEIVEAYYNLKYKHKNDSVIELEDHLLEEMFDGMQSIYTGIKFLFSDSQIESGNEKHNEKMDNRYKIGGD